ncbi:hypothetical protein HDE_07668 [Halotydeus destructor]|nr:hypothetical protein HDE_07668 [Halotydeus destructor]
MEADLHTLTYCLLLHSLVVKPKAGNAMFADRKTARSFIGWARHMVQFYVEGKRHFVEKYSAILAENVLTNTGDNVIAATL